MKDTAKLPENKLAALKRAQNEVAAEALEKFFAGHPADKALSASLRARRFLGSRDRRFISENIFALFRWWGWIKECTGANCEIRSLAASCDALGQALETASAIRTLLEKSDIRGLAAELSSRFSVPVAKFADERLFPDFFVSKLSHEFEFRNLCPSFQLRPPIWIRTRHGQRQTIAAALRKHKTAFSLPDRFPDSIKAFKSDTSLYAMPEFKSGLFDVQDLASQIIGIVADAKPGEKWLDACAGAGGKTLQISDMMEGKGSILSQDLDERKIIELKKRAARSSLSNIRTRVADSAKKDKRWEQFFDGVLVDAPCSCSGAWRRNPDGRWRIKESDLEKFYERQLALIDASASALRIGGTLIYATCSVFRRENEDVASAFLDANKNFQLDEFINPLGGKSLKGLLHVNPADMDSDAAFIAKLKKTQ